MEDVLILIRQNILPRLDNLDGSMHELREATWPICQGLRDGTCPLQHFKEKKRVLHWLPLDEIRNLLRRKAVFMGISQDLVPQELQSILIHRE
jgi:hypothetical protein